MATQQQLLQQTIQNGCIRVSSGDVDWYLHLRRGQLVYATHSIEAFERFERHLRWLRREVKTLPDKIWGPLRLQFEGEVNGEYGALRWLQQEGYLAHGAAEKLFSRMVQEVLELFWCLSPQDWTVAIEPEDKRLGPTGAFALNLGQAIPVIEERLAGWRALGPAIATPFQCPYLVSQSLASKRLSPALVQQLGKVLRGFNFRQLEALWGRDALTIARQLHPLVVEGAIVLREPAEPWQRLPRTYPAPMAVLSASTPRGTEIAVADGDWANTLTKAGSRVWKVVCIDDSAAMLDTLRQYLDSEEFEVVTLKDSVQALMRLVSIRPDLILMDVGMPGVDGYQLCSLIRKSSVLRETPVVMVTGNRGLLDRARARLVGASDYLTKPFTQGELLKMVMRHLL